MRFENLFETEGDLIVEVAIAGPRGADTARLVLDTGAALTTGGCSSSTRRLRADSAVRRPEHVATTTARIFRIGTSSRRACLIRRRHVSAEIRDLTRTRSAVVFDAGRVDVEYLQVASNSADLPADCRRDFDTTTSASFNTDEGSAGIDSCRAGPRHC
jgi:hypothetical protein